MSSTRRPVLALHSGGMVILANFKIESYYQPKEKPGNFMPMVIFQV